MTPDGQAHVLIVDDQAANLLVLENVLGDLGVRLVRAESGEEALRCVLNVEFAAILLDVNMPRMGGLETAQIIRSRARSRHTPIIFLTANDSSPEWVDEAYKLGAVDYLTKPLVPVILRAKVSVFVELYRLRENERANARAVAHRAARLLDNMADAAFALDRDFRYTYVNRRWEEMFVRTAAATLGKTVWDLFPALGGTPVEGAYRRAMRDREKAALEHLSVYTETWLEIRAYPTDEGLAVFIRDISERKRTEEALREKDQRLSLLVQNIKDYAVIITCTVGRVLEWGGGAAEITGFSAEEAVGQRTHIVFTAEDVAAGRPEEEMRIAATEGRAEDKRWHQKKDGSRFFASGVMVPLYDRAGELRGYGKVFRDETERKQAEERLRRAHDELEERVIERTAELSREQTFLKAVLDNIQDGIVACDPDGMLTLFNRATCEFHGLPAGPLPASAWASHYALYRSDGTTPLTDDEVPLIRALRGEYVRDVEMVIASRAQAPRTVLASGQLLRDASGRKLGAVVSMHDITDRKARAVAQEEVAREQERSEALRKVARASHAMNSVLNAESIARIVTAEARALIGVHQSATSFTEAADPTRAVHTVVLSDKYRGFRPGSAEIPTPALHPLVQGATAPVRLSRKELEAHPLYDQIRHGIFGWPPPCGWLSVPLIGYSGKTLGFIQLSDKEVGEFTDEDEALLMQLAAIAAAGIENAGLYERLKEQDARKDEFLATLAHELRNPLAPVRAGLELLHKIDISNPTAARIRDMMDRQLGHLVHLVDDLLDVSRVTSGKIALKLERLDVRAVLEAAIETSRPLVEAAGHELVLSLPANPLFVDGDKHRLAQVLTNLVNNAAKYTPSGGTIRVHVQADKATGDALLVVKDTGIGLPPEMLPKIFDMFTQVGASIDRAQGGLGLGLTLVRKLVGMHRGTVTAESAGLGRGSTFTVRLPLAPAESVDGAPNEFDEPSVLAQAPRRILVVDDNEDAAETLAMLLSLGGHDVRTAYTGPAGLAAAREFLPDVMFLDIGLPGMTGYEVVRTIRQDPALGGRVVMVAVTGWGTEDDRSQAREAGFDHHLTKPVDPDRLLELLATLTP